MKKLLLLPILPIVLLTACKKDQLETKSPPPHSEEDAIFYSINSFDGQASKTLQVSGTIEEGIFQFVFNVNGVTMTSTDTWNGSLTGNGQVHIFSTETINLDSAI